MHRARRDSDRLTETVRTQLVAMSPAKNARYPAAKSATRPGATLRSTIGIRRGMDVMEQAPSSSRSTWSPTAGTP